MTMYSVSQVTEIMNGLYLTSVYGATRDNILKRNTTLLINSAQELPKQEVPGVESIKLYLDDTPAALINVYFDRMADKMNEHLTRNGKVIVHCVMGVSRSCSLVLAYLMKYKAMTLKQAFDLVSSKRSVVRPNPGFWRQLLEYEKRLNSFKSTSSYERYQPPQQSHHHGSTGTNIPIHFESSSHPQSLINALTLSNNYTDFRPYSASRVPSSTPHRSSSTHNNSYNTDRSSAAAAGALNNYSSYVSPVAAGAGGSQHRTSLISGANSKYTRPSGMSTTYRQSYGKY